MAIAQGLIQTMTILTGIQKDLLTGAGRQLGLSEGGDGTHHATAGKAQGHKDDTTHDPFSRDYSC